MEQTQVAQLVVQAKAGDQAAFGQLYDEYAQRIFRFIRYKVPSQEQAEDIFQDVFLKAWQALAGFKLEGMNFSAWLYQIARNTINDYYRRVYRTPASVELTEDLALHSSDNPLAEAALGNDLEHAKVALNALSATYRQVLELRFIQEFSVAETAEVMGKTALAIRLIQHRALLQLRSKLSSYEYQPAKI